MESTIADEAKRFVSVGANERGLSMDALLLILFQE
jgi:hypothetical protein